MEQVILWRRLDRPGHESARLFFENALWRLTGAAVFAHEGQPCRLDYTVVCDSDWKTLRASVAGWIGREVIDTRLSVSSGRWIIDGSECPGIENCIDIDLNFSPSTNLLPIRRLNLAVGEETPVRAAWLRFPGFVLEPLDQIYRRTGEKTYRYESAGGSFAADLEVNEAGFVTLYPSFWKAQSSA
jgi:hypothetical protein